MHGCRRDGPMQVQATTSAMSPIEKTFQKLFRPKLHVCGVWIHGSNITFNVSDESLLKNSGTQCEVYSRGIQDTLNRHGTLPHGLAIQQDNCPREGKNQFVLSWMILTVSLGCFRWCAASYLRVGHSSFEERRTCFNFSFYHSLFIMY